MASNKQTKKQEIAKKHPDKWTKSEITGLIYHYEINPLMWDKSNANYRNNKERVRILEGIATTLHRSTEDCRKKWKYIRNKLNKELKTIQDSNSPDTRVVKWEFFNQLKFLYPSLSLRNVPNSTLQTTDTAYCILQRLDVGDDSQNSANEYDMNNVIKVENNINLDKDILHPTHNVSHSSIEQESSCDDTRTEFSPYDILEIKIDPCQMFGDFVRDQLKPLGFEERVELQKVLITTILEYQSKIDKI